MNSSLQVSHSRTVCVCSFPMYSAWPSFCLPMIVSFSSGVSCLLSSFTNEFGCFISSDSVWQVLNVMFVCLLPFLVWNTPCVDWIQDCFFDLHLRVRPSTVTEDLTKVCGGISWAFPLGELAGCFTQCLFSVGSRWGNYSLLSSCVWFLFGRVN